MSGNFVWYELMAGDPDVAKAFYTKVIGWNTQQWDQGEMSYTMWAVGEQSVGGLHQLPEEAAKMGAPPHWLAHITCDDVDATATLAVELGATVHVAPMDIPTVGRFAVIADPQGAVFAAFKPAGEMPVPETAPGIVSWRELATTDHEAAFAFYEKLFGWHKTDAMDMGEGTGIYQMFGNGGTTLGGIWNKPADMPMSHWLFYITVEDVNATVETAQANGAKLLNGPMEVPGGDVIAQFMDPQGAAFAIVGPQAS